MGQAVKYLWIVVAAFSVSFGCSDAPIETSEDQREWLAEYGAQGPFEQVVGSGKEDGAGMVTQSLDSKLHFATKKKAKGTVQGQQENV